LEDADPSDVLILLDDFAGSGETFIEWYDDDKTNLRNLKEVYYCVFMCYHKAITNILTKTGIKTITAYEYGNPTCY
jgi:hypothetical protein